MAACLLVTHQRALAHEMRSGEESLTRFEHFAFDDCSPCLKESIALPTLTIAPVDLTAWSRNPTAKTPRAYEIGVEALRSRVLDQPSRQLLALQISLSVATAPGQMYQLGSGVVDEDEVAALITDLGDIIRSASAKQDSVAGNIDMSLHTGSVRLGVLRTKTDSIAYLQTGDVHTFARKAVFDVPSTLFLPVADLPKLKDAIAQASARMQEMRAAR